MTQLDVVIVGKPKSGKTTLALIIATALKEHGIDAVLHDEDTKPEALATATRGIKTRAGELKGKMGVLIRYVQAPAATKNQVLSPKDMRPIIWPGNVNKGKAENAKGKCKKPAG